MKIPARGAAALCLVVVSSLCVALYWAYGLLAAAVAAASAAVVGSMVALVRERHVSARLEDALIRETERSHRAAEQAWQSALLTQVADELRTTLEEDALLTAAARALGTAMKASRAVVYGGEPGDMFRIRAQFAADALPPLGSDEVLPAALSSDLALASRLSEIDTATTARGSLHADPELRALAQRLQVQSAVVVPVGAEFILCAHPSQDAPAWSDTERRFVQRFAVQLASSLELARETRRERQRSEMRSNLLRVAHALARTRESRAVLEIATSVGAPLTGAHASAVLVDRDGYGFHATLQQGFVPELSARCIQSIETALEEALRARGVTLGDTDDALVARRPEARKFGPLAIMPLHYGREVMGVFLFERSPAERAWSDDDVEIVETLGALTASALKNASLFESLESAERRYTELYENAPDLYQSIDAKGRILDSNATACRALDYEKDDLIGRRFESLLTSESVARWQALEVELFDRGSVRGENLKLKTRDSRSIDVSLSAAVVPPSDDEPMYARVVMRDMSEQRQFELQLRQNQKLEVVGALAGGIAHDFNNVLGGIVGYASLLHTYLRDRPDVQRFAHTIERSAMRGAELTGRLLAASRDVPARKQPVNLNDVVEETLELLAHTLHEPIRVGKRLDSRVRSILTKAGQLQQIVLNLCVNARDAMPDGGLLQIETEVDEHEGRMRLSVEDAGVGIEPATMQRLFEPFFSTKGDGGNGLGLSVVYEIVRSLGGEVRVKSSPGRGARFDIFLPVQWVDTHDESTDAVEPVHGSGELVLLVDDEHVLRELGKDILETHGYRVQAVGSGEDALSFIRDSSESVALVILDLVMPGLDGGETYRRLRRVAHDVPVLLSSGLSSEDAVEQILADGAAGFIPKPYGIGELTHAVSQAIGTEPPALIH